MSGNEPSAVSQSKWSGDSGWRALFALPTRLMASPDLDPVERPVLLVGNQSRPSRAFDVAFAHSLHLPSSRIRRVAWRDGVTPRTLAEFIREVAASGLMVAGLVQWGGLGNPSIADASTCGSAPSAAYASGLRYSRHPIAFSRRHARGRRLEFDACWTQELGGNERCLRCFGCAKKRTARGWQSESPRLLNPLRLFRPSDLIVSLEL